MLCCGIISCTPVPKPSSEQKICGIPGPEDVIIDNTGSHKTLLISSTDRRHKTALGKILRYDPKAKTLSTLNRVGDSAYVKTFNPHGIDLVKGNDGIDRLYVVSHPTKKTSQILVYRLVGNSLIFESCPSKHDYNCLIQSANDITATPSGVIYVSNLRNRTIARYNPKDKKSGRWTRLKTKLLATNGVFLHKGNLYCSGIAGKVVKLTPSPLSENLNRSRYLQLCGALDNFNPAPSYTTTSKVLVTTHTNPARFALHAWFPSLSSPARVFAVSLDNPHDISEIRMTNGARLPISGGSSAAIIDEELFVGQAIGNFVLHLKRGEWRNFPLYVK